MRVIYRTVHCDGTKAGRTRRCLVIFGRWIIEYGPKLRRSSGSVPSDVTSVQAATVPRGD